MKLVNTLKQVGLRRLLAAGVGVGILVMGIDAGIAHFAGRTLKHTGQLIPVVFGPLAFVALAAMLRTDRRRRVFDRVARTVGALTAGVGLLGSAYHFAAFARYFADQSITTELVEMALMLAPPLMAPGAFVAMGAALFLLAARGVTVTMRPVRPVRALA